MSSAGAVEWQRELRLEDELASLWAGVLAGRDGDAYVVGYAARTMRSPTRLMIARTRADGELHWSKTFDFGADTHAKSVARSRAGAVIVAGFLRHTGAGGSVFVAGFNPAGDLLWHRRIVEVREEPEIQLQELRGGGHLVSGSFGVIRVNAEGLRQWDHTGIDVVAAVETRDGIAVISWLSGSGTPGFTVRMMTAEGEIRSTSKQPVLPDLVAAGMFNQDSSNALRGWYLRAPLTR